MSGALQVGPRLRGRWRQTREPAMDVKLKPFDFAQAAAKAGLRTDGTPLRAPALPAGDESGSFRTAMASALQQVSRAQLESSRLQREVQLDNPTVSLEETMVAMTRANLGFTAAVQVRNRLVQAYTDIMNMQV
jgi:flagellar hook-basal body complex protein FliE